MTSREKREENVTAPKAMSRAVVVKAHITEPNSVNKIEPIYIESIVLDNVPVFLIAGKTRNSEGKIEFGLIYCDTDIELPKSKKVLVPIESEDCPYMPYAFTSKEFEGKIKDIAFDDLYKRVLHEVKWFIEVDDDIQHLLTAVIFFTMKQDKSNTTPYLFVVGDFESGKSSIQYLLKLLGYRPLWSDSLPPADVYNYLGVYEEASGIILEDEATYMEKDYEKMKIYRGGYAKGSKVPRIIEVNGKPKQAFYNNYCFKAFAGERLPAGNAFRSRCIPIKLLEGFPKGNIKDPTAEEKERLVKLRKDLLIWRLQTADQELENFKLDFLKNRDEEIWRPLLRVVYGTKYYDRMLEVCKKYVLARQQEKSESLEAFIFKLVKELMRKDLVITFKELWNVLLKYGVEDKDNSSRLLLEEYGMVTKTSIGRLLTEKFKGEKYRDEKGERATKFNKDTLSKLERRYLTSSTSLTEPIEHKEPKVRHRNASKQAEITNKRIPKPSTAVQAGQASQTSQAGQASQTSQTGQLVKIGEKVLVDDVAFTVSMIKDDVYTLTCDQCKSSLVTDGNGKKLEDKLRRHAQLYH